MFREFIYILEAEFSALFHNNCFLQTFEPLILGGKKHSPKKNWMQKSCNSRQFFINGTKPLHPSLTAMQVEIARLRLLPKVDSLSQRQLAPVVDSAAIHKKNQQQKQPTRILESITFLIFEKKSHREEKINGLTKLSVSYIVSKNHFQLHAHLRWLSHHRKHRQSQPHWLGCLHLQYHNHFLGAYMKIYK